MCSRCRFGHRGARGRLLVRSRDCAGRLVKKARNACRRKRLAEASVNPMISLQVAQPTSHSPSQHGAVGEGVPWRQCSRDSQAVICGHAMDLRHLCGARKGSYGTKAARCGRCPDCGGWWRRDGGRAFGQPLPPLCRVIQCRCRRVGALSSAMCQLVPPSLALPLFGQRQCPLSDHLGRSPQKEE